MRSRLAVIAVLVVLTAAGCRRGASSGSEKTAADRVSKRTVQLFYQSGQQLLVPESRAMMLPESEAAALAPVMRELIKGPRNQSVARSFPADASVRAAFLLPDGNAVIDLGGPTLTSGWNSGSHEEMMAAYSVVETAMTNFPSVRRVRILINGQVAETLAGSPSPSTRSASASTFR